MSIVRTQQALFTPVRMGKLELRNRIVMAPLTRMRAANGGHAPTELQAGYYAQRASAGLIIGECTEISRKAYGWADTPGLWSAEQVRGWRGVTSALHIFEFAREVFMALLSKSQFIGQLAHGKVCRSLGSNEQ